MPNKVLAYIIMFNLTLGFFLGIYVGITNSPFLGVAMSMFCLVVFCLLFVRRVTITRWILKA